MVLPFLAAAGSTLASGFAAAGGLQGIGSAFNLANSIFGPSPERTQKRQANFEYQQQKKLEENRYTWLRDGALKAGFNPASVLSSTGGTMGRVNQQSPLQDKWEKVGETLLEVDRIMDPVRQETERLNLELMREELVRAKQENANPYGAVPQVQKSQGHVKTSGQNRESAIRTAETRLGEVRTSLGQTLNYGEVADDTRIARQNIEANNQVYRLGDLPPGYPNQEWMENTFGDDSFPTRLHAKVTPFVWAWHNREELGEEWNKFRKPKRDQDRAAEDRARRSFEHWSGGRKPGSNIRYDSTPWFDGVVNHPIWDRF